MNLISCKACGIVLDKNYLNFPPVLDHDTMEIIPENVEWDSEEEDYVAIVPCPVCEKNIKED